MSRALMKELIKGLLKPFTIGYPSVAPRKYAQIVEGLRGKHEVQEDKCIGCGACARRCSTGALKLTDHEFKRTLSVSLKECIFCYRCVEVCPEDALSLSTDFELARTRDEERDLEIKWMNELSKCLNCGKPITTSKQIERVRERVIENIAPQAKGVIAEDLKVFLNYCPACRKELAYKLGFHPAKYYLVLSTRNVT
ncbi:MAG: 4Fe-4S binding protein [Thermoprotei archaeon]|nr:4Fe-4S binding protein [Thermoprotei archaeon]